MALNCRDGDDLPLLLRAMTSNVGYGGAMRTEEPCGKDRALRWGRIRCDDRDHSLSTLMVDNLK